MAEASRLAEEEAKKKAEEEAKKQAEEEAKAAEEALQKEMEELGIAPVEEGVLAELAAACEKEDYEAAWEIMLGDAFAEEVGDMKENDRRIVQTPSGRMGIYYVNCDAYIPIGNVCVYFGDYSGDQRDGNGIWLNVDYVERFEQPEYHYITVSEWKNDLPNGAFHTEYAYNNQSFTDEGTTVNGWYDGTFTSAFTDRDGNESSESSTFSNGQLVIDGVTVDEKWIAQCKAEGGGYTFDNGIWQYEVGGKYYTEERLLKTWALLGFGQ